MSEDQEELIAMYELAGYTFSLLIYLPVPVAAQQLLSYKPELVSSFLSENSHSSKVGLRQI